MCKLFRYSSALWVLLGLSAALGARPVLAESPDVEAWREELYRDWKRLAIPPITPYNGPFGGESRAFVGKADFTIKDKQAVANWKAQHDYSHTAKNGIYDPRLDPRPINHEFEAAILEDWRRMGYNCAYKGKSFTYMVGSYLKEQGMLGAIDQTLFGQNGPPPLGFDGSQGRKQRESCGSFFHPDNYRAGVDAIAGMGHHYGKHLFTVGDHKLTCSWDEVGMRTRAQLDYRDSAIPEFRRFLAEVWFGDESPDRDTNGDGRTYNQFTGERLANWDEVQPIPLSLDWAMPVLQKDGTIQFSAQSDVDQKIYEMPGRFKLWIDFHRYFTFEFFRRINDDATRHMNEQGTSGRITCYPFVQHFIIWPGINQRHGNSFYWYHRLCPVVNVEHCWPDHPVMNLNYAITDRMAPRWKNLVMGWVWFYFGSEGADMYNGPHDIERAMVRMMGHTVDGTHHWLDSPVYRGRDQSQRRQIAYWQNFLATHFAKFLSRSSPPQPEIALLMPDWTGYFYRTYQYPKQDWAYTAEAFQNLQHAYHIITEEELELEPDTLDRYRALYVVGSEWTTPTIRSRVEKFLARGGVLFANFDSLSLDIPTGQRTDFLEKVCGVRLLHKYKNGYFPSAQTAEEALALEFDRGTSPTKLQGHHVHLPDDPRAWSRLHARTAEKYQPGPDGKPARDVSKRAIRHEDWKLMRDAQGKIVRDEAAWKELDALMQNMPRESRGLRQSPIDMRSPPIIEYAPRIVPLQAKSRRREQAENWAEYTTARITRGEPIAWQGQEVVGVETDQSVWLGTREGLNIHARAPRMPMHRTTEPCNPFPNSVHDDYESRRPHVEAIGYAAAKAKVARPVTVWRSTAGIFQQPEVPLNLEVLPRVDDQGSMMLFIINHDASEGEYLVEIGPALMKKLRGAVAWDMLAEKVLAEKLEGRFKVAIAPFSVQAILVGQRERVAPIQADQARLNRKDLSVPKYFLDRPELNTPEHEVAIPSIEK